MEKKTLIRKYYTCETKAAEDGEDRTLIVTISTPTADRSGDIVHPEGVILDNYKKNPVVAAFHNYRAPAIGVAKEIEVTTTGIIAKVEFVKAGVNPQADMLFEMYKTGVMNAWSIGFIGTKWNWIGQEWASGREFSEWELLEFSAVLVPDNPEALTMFRSKGFEVEPEAEETQVIELQEEEKDQEPEETKEGRVLSEKNRSLIKSVMEKMNDATSAMKELLEATEKTEEEKPTEEEPKSQEAEEDTQIKFLKSVREQLRATDKGVGILLRDMKTYLDTKK